jgi:hypothetical protein
LIIFSGFGITHQQKSGSPAPTNTESHSQKKGISNIGSAVSFLRRAWIHFRRLEAYINSSLGRSQGGQIGRIFAQWAIFLLWAVFLKITKIAQIFVPLFLRNIDYVLIRTKIGSGNLFTNSSG